MSLDLPQNRIQRGLTIWDRGTSIARLAASIILVGFFVYKFLLSSTSGFYYLNDLNDGSSYFVMEMLVTLFTLLFMGVFASSNNQTSFNTQGSTFFHLVALALMTIALFTLIIPLALPYFNFETSKITVLLLIAFNRFLSLFPFTEEKFIDIQMYFWISGGSLLLSFLGGGMILWGVIYYSITGILLPIFYFKEFQWLRN